MQTPSFLRSCHKPSWKETEALAPSRLSILVKHRVDAIDKENLTHTYSIIEGDALSDVIESITYHIKIVSTEDGGSICKNRSFYNTKGDAEISEEKINEGKDKAMAMFKAIEAYLTANSDA